MTLSTYRPSGRVPRSGVLAIGAAGLAALSTALAYAWLMTNVLSPLKMDHRLLFSLFAALGIAAWMSVLARRVAAYGKIRNPAWMGRGGAGLGLLAWYVQWAACIVISGIRDSGERLDFSSLEFIARLCFRPEALFVWAFEIPLINASVSLQSGLVICWLIEFFVYFFPPMLAGRRRAGLPFCETGDQWATEIELAPDFEWLAEPQAVRQLLEVDPGHFASLLVPRTEDSTGNHARVTIYRCKGPESFITIMNREAMPLEAAPLPSEVKNLMGASSGNVECFCEEPVVELLRVPIADPDALLRRWHDAVNDRRTGPGPDSESEVAPVPILSKP